MLRRIVRRVKRGLAAQPTDSRLYGDPARFHDLLADEYVGYLQTVVGGWLPTGNVRALECCLRNMPAEGAIVEVGSFLGLSTNVIAYASYKYGRKNPFFTCDSWLFDGMTMVKNRYFDMGTAEFRDYVMRVYKMNMSLFSRDFSPRTVEVVSDQFFEMWGAGARATDVLGREAQLGGPISFAYIDGDHGYESARRDYANVERFLLPHGYVLFDDSADDSTFEGLRLLMREVEANPNFEMVLKAPNYCFRKRA